MIPMLETERLQLRAPCAEDAPIYAAFFADGEASRFYGGPLREDQAWRQLAVDLGHWQLRGHGRWAVVRRDTGAMIGGCGLWWASGWPRRELTWWLVPQARGAGYATEASRAAIAYGYDTLRWSLVETHMDDANHAARRLAERLGGKVIAREGFPDGKARDVFGLPHPETAGA
ncbi:MAG: GNAT family N-acetyltransferase [Pseudomonadota bacterium]